MNARVIVQVDFPFTNNISSCILTDCFCYNFRAILWK